MGKETHFLAIVSLVPYRIFLDLFNSVGLYYPIIFQWRLKGLAGLKQHSAPRFHGIKHNLASVDSDKQLKQLKWQKRATFKMPCKGKNSIFAKI